MLWWHIGDDWFDRLEGSNNNRWIILLYLITICHMFKTVFFFSLIFLPHNHTPPSFCVCSFSLFFYLYTSLLYCCDVCLCAACCVCFSHLSITLCRYVSVCVGSIFPFSYYLLAEDFLFSFFFCLYIRVIERRYYV